MEELRPGLGDFSSIVCFKAAVVGIEDVLGAKGARTVLVAAGRKRGKQIVASLGLEGADNLDDVREAVDQAVGKSGTRLCSLDGLEEKDGVVLATVSETLCMAGEPQGSKRECSFTLGAVQGALEAVTGKAYRGTHATSRWRGAKEDVFEFSPRI